MSFIPDNPILGDPMDAEAMAHHHYAEEHGEEHLDDSNSQNVLVAKAVTMVVLCVVSTCMGILPMLLARWFKWNTSENVTNPRSTKVVSLLLGFGGGVLFCTTFLHLIPEVSESVKDLEKKGSLPKLNFSLAEVLTCTGFFIMYFVEESVHTHLRNRQSRRNNNALGNNVSHSTNELVENGRATSAYSNSHSHVNGHGHSHHLPEITSSGDDDFVISSLRGLLIVLGLSVHELFEGLAIGLESSSNYVWYMFAAVAAHKFVIAFCIGIELLASRTRRYLSVIYVCTFAVVSPLGIGIGMLLVGGEGASASGPLAVILQGLASGTLLYVVFFEILQDHRTGLNQYVSILVGFILMFGLQMLTAHSHSHSHTHAHSHGEHDHEVGHEDEHEHEHDHGHAMGSLHLDNGGSERLLGDAIERVTQNVADALSNVLSSNATGHDHSQKMEETMTTLINGS